MKLKEMIPDAEAICSLDPQELGLRLLKVLITWNQIYPYTNVDIDTFVNLTLGKDRLTGPSDFEEKFHNDIEDAIREAWAWLEGAALLIPQYRGAYSSKTRRLSRRAIQLANSNDPFKSYASLSIRKEILHPAIREEVWADFHRGRLDNAIFNATKAVEIAVRGAAELTGSDLGVGLMRRAFHPDCGPLTDMAAEAAEREARSALFAGIIGAYKNPVSHRQEIITDPEEAAEIILMANHLLRIVDARRAARQKSPN